MAGSLRGRDLLESLVEQGSDALPEARIDVRPEIVASWRRAAMSGLHPERVGAVHATDLELDTRFRRSAGPVLAALAEKLGDTRATLLLADQKARVIGRWDAGRDLRRQLDRQEVCERFQCDEEYIGTNGVGTAMEEDRPLVVAGGEHFGGGFAQYTCVGAPVRHPITGRVEGVVDLTVLYEDTNDLMLPLMLQAAREIVTRLYEEASVAERILLESFLKAVRRTRRPIVSMNADVLITNASAARLLQGVDQALLWEQVAQSVLEHPGGAGEFFVADQLHSTRCMAITDGDRLVGALIEFGSPADGDASPRRRAPATAQLPGLVGRSPAWNHLVSQLLRLRAANTRVVIAGEPGAGKLAALQSAFPAPGGEQAPVLDCVAGMAVGLASWAPEVDTVLSARPAAAIFRHLDALPEEAVAAITPSLARYLADGGHVHGTVRTRSGDVDSGAASFIERFDCVRVVLQPLRFRPEDIAPLATALLREISGGDDLRLSSGVVQTLMRLAWPANIPQLRTVLRALASQRTVGEIVVSDLPTELRKQATRGPLTALERAECDVIIDAIDVAGGNKLEAAKNLGISRTTLYRKMRSYGVDLEHSFF